MYKARNQAILSTVTVTARRCGWLQVLTHHSFSFHPSWRLRLVERCAVKFCKSGYVPPLGWCGHYTASYRRKQGLCRSLSFTRRFRVSVILICTNRLQGLGIWWRQASPKRRHLSKCTTRFNIQQFYVLPTQCIYVFCVDLRTNSDYFPIQH